MDVNHVAAAAPHPVERLIRAHAERHARPHVRSDAVRRAVRIARAPGPGCDRRQCRILLNAARREIDRRRGGLLTAAERMLVARRAEPSGAGPPQVPAASPPTQPKAYAPAPVGKPAVVRGTTPPDPAELVRAINYFHVTNLGTLLDMLA